MRVAKVGHKTYQASNFGRSRELAGICTESAVAAPNNVKTASLAPHMLLDFARGERKKRDQHRLGASECPKNENRPINRGSWFASWVNGAICSLVWYLSVGDAEKTGSA